LEPLGVLDGGPPTVPRRPLRVPTWFLRTPCEVPTAFCGGFFGFAMLNFLTLRSPKMQPKYLPNYFQLVDPIFPDIYPSSLSDTQVFQIDNQV
jgi:hypothetical protein